MWISGSVCGHSKRKTPDAEGCLACFRNSTETSMAGAQCTGEHGRRSERGKGSQIIKGWWSV